MEGLKISNRERLRGMNIFCTRCNAPCSSKGKENKVTWKCKLNGKHLSTCPNPQSHKFISYLYNPITRKSDIIIKHDTRDFWEFQKRHNDLLKLEREVRNLIKQGNIEKAHAIIQQLKPSVKKQQEILKKEEPQEVSYKITASTYLETAMTIYNEWLKGSHREEWEEKQYAIKTIRNYQKSLNEFHAVLVKNGYHPQFIELSKVSEVHKMCWAKDVYSRGLSDYRKESYISDVNSFLNWCRDKINGKVRKRRNRAKKGDKTVTTVRDFEKMIQFVTPENAIGIETWTDSKTGQQKEKRKNYYRHWLSDGMWLSVLLGGRGEEVINFRWNEVKEVEYEGGAKAYWIELRDQKVEGKEDNIIVMYQKTYEILQNLGLKEKIGTTEYVLNPAEMDRRKMVNFIGKAWRHYWRDVAKLDPKVKWKSLRSTNITLSNILAGDKAKFIKKHTNADTERTHYLNSQIAAASVFGEDFKDVVPEKAIKE